MKTLQKIPLKDSGEIIFKNKASSLSRVEVSKLFDRFYTVKNAKGSSGPGLSIARELTEIMGGTIDSEINEGILSIILMLKISSFYRNDLFLC